MVTPKHTMPRAHSLLVHTTTKRWPHGLDYLYPVLALQAMQQFSARSVGSRIIILGYAFLVMILINA